MRVVEGFRGGHDGGGEGVVGAVVAADVGGCSLDGEEFGGDGVFFGR